MKIVRVMNPMGLDLLKDKLLEDEDSPREQVLEQLRGLMTQVPDRTFIVAIVDGQSIEGFLVAVAPVDQKYVFIYQAWVSPRLINGRIKDRLFLRLLQWCETLQRFELRTETKRSAEAFYRRWGFTEFSKILNYRFTEDFEDSLFDHSGLVKLSKENESARLEDGNDVDPDAGAGDVDRTTQQIPAGADRPATGVVPGPDGSSASAGAAEHPGTVGKVDSESTDGPGVE